MIEAQDRMILLSGQTAKRFHQNALHPSKNPEREQLFAELDTMQIVEQTPKKLTNELPVCLASKIRLCDWIWRSAVYSLPVQSPGWRERTTMALPA